MSDSSVYHEHTAHGLTIKMVRSNAPQEDDIVTVDMRELDTDVLEVWCIKALTIDRIRQLGPQRIHLFRYALDQLAHYTIDAELRRDC